MQNFSYHVPFFVVTNGVATSGHSADLKPGQVGLFDRTTWSVATASGNGTEFFFAQGNTGGKDWYTNPVKESHKSAFFRASDVLNMYMSRPKRIQNEEWVIGYDGSPSSVGFKFQKGKTVSVKFMFTGGPIYRFFGGPKEYLVSYTPQEDCVQPCGPDCADVEIKDCLYHTKKLIDLINEHTELQTFGVKATLVTYPFSPTAVTSTKWCIDVCDNGDDVALQAVQAQAPQGVVVTRIDRKGSISTYSFSNDGTTPPQFVQKGSVKLAVCKTCPSGSTLISAKDVYLVKRTITPTTNLSSPSAQQTYADGVANDYKSAKTITVPTSGVGTSYSFCRFVIICNTICICLLSSR